MPDIPEPAAHLSDGLPVFSESQMLRFAKQYGRDLLEEAAKKCDALYFNLSAGTDTCAQAIRKLKETL